MVMDQKAKLVQPGYSFSTVAHSVKLEGLHGTIIVMFNEILVAHRLLVVFAIALTWRTQDALRIGEDPDNFVLADYAFNISMDYTRAYFLIPRKSELYGFVSNGFMNNRTRMEVNIGAECAMESEVCTQRCNSRDEEASFTCGPRSLYVMPYFFREHNPLKPYPQVASSCVCQKSSAGLNPSTFGGTQLKDMAFGGYNNNMWLILALLCFVLAVLNIIMKYKSSRPSLPMHVVMKN
ncbi:hypothetical protein MP228_012429 [Amoeboaphelidium protococcarum]|nr:hypothetical protein MP228_012429 [Amoeboaphelidium protococcarum]